ncbi:MAG: branched-chain amino acid ABC transporter permease [Alphaproteobacteria bacterium HGW-Alphaproteobacteria-2]|nr:MAG: branched-chain amino acid ABC transporter permease [Alphaproteobacteria bacterium HGW-Alphaproteobacteria-2]
MAQLVLNGLVTGMVVALGAVALTLTYSILKFPNFAVGGMITLGAYIAWLVNVPLGLPLPGAAVLAAIGLAAVMLAADRFVFRPLRDRGAITLLVAAMGLSLILENICRLAFGNVARNFDVDPERPWRVSGLRIHPEQVTTAVVTVAAMAGLWLVLRHTRLGRAMRAVADNPDLAAVRGIDRDRVTRRTWVLAAALVALSGVLIGMDRAIDPLMGWAYIIPVFAAAILGGLGSPGGAVLGALLIGVAQELSVLVIEPNYRQVVGFVAIALVLLARPRGLLGVEEIRR